MLWLALHMWVLLFTAFAIGLGAGWWIWGQRQAPPAPVPTGDASRNPIEMGSLNLDDETPSHAGAKTP